MTISVLSNHGEVNLISITMGDTRYLKLTKKPDKEIEMRRISWDEFKKIKMELNLKDFRS